MTSEVVEFMFDKETGIVLGFPGLNSCQFENVYRSYIMFFYLSCGCNYGGFYGTRKQKMVLVRR